MDGRFTEIHNSGHGSFTLTYYVKQLPYKFSGGDKKKEVNVNESALFLSSGMPFFISTVVLKGMLTKYMKLI